jgi:hypothetical protein
MIDELAGTAVREVLPAGDPDRERPPCAAPAAARAGAGAAAIPDEDVELPDEHPAASRQAPASSAPDAAARQSNDDVMPLRRAGRPARFPVA